MSMKLKVEGAVEREPVGLKDGGHVYLRCSNCRAGLVDIWVTRPNQIDPATKEVFVWDMKANCPFCGDSSFITQVRGGFHVSGFGKVKEDDPDDAIMSTLVEFSEPQADGILFHKVIKANAQAKPIIG